MYQLVIQDDEGKTTVVPLIRDELTIGRQEGNTIRLTERNVSRKHAKLRCTEPEITIEDLDSYNGIRVNGSRIQGKAVIHESDRVQIGDYLIEVKSDEDAVNSDTPTDSGIAAPSVVPVAVSDSATMPVPALKGDDEVTDSVPQLEDQTDATIHDFGRLVVLSSPTAGQEFELSTTPMVIGRTSENDIWLNHSSISRHHAKIAYKDGVYTIADLDSANGIRVNNEEYGKVELRRGDVIDLGHVRLRYVAPGEDFVFGRDAQAVDIGGEAKKGRSLWVVLGILLVGAAATVLVLQEGTSLRSKKTAQKDTAVTQLGTYPVVADANVGTRADSVAQDGPRARTDGFDLAAAQASAVAARDAEDWDSLVAVAESMLAADPTNAQGAALAARGAAERKNKVLYDEFFAAVEKRIWAKVADGFAKIPADSVYKTKAEPEHTRLKDEFARYQLQVASKSASRGKCRELERMAGLVPEAWDDVANQIVQLDCKNVASTPKTPPPKKEIVQPVQPDPSYDELIAEATAASKAKEYGRSLAYCQRALEVRPNDQQALMVCAVASCNLKKAKAAKEFIRKINSARYQAMTRKLCLIHEIVVE